MISGSGVAVTAMKLEPFVGTGFQRLNYFTKEQKSRKQARDAYVSIDGLQKLISRYCISHEQQILPRICDIIMYLVYITS